MQDVIKELLGTEYLMFYHPAIPTQDLVPGVTYNEIRSAVNLQIQQLGRRLNQWPAEQLDTIANLVRVNWIVQRLGIEPIRKPVLAHLDNQQLKLNCGDTRLMAVTAVSSTRRIQVVVTCVASDREYFKNWIPVTCSQDLMIVSGFNPRETTVLANASKNCNYAIDWLEIGDSSTAHHLHDVNQRVRMMQNYLDQQLDSFTFSESWLNEKIIWEDYDI